MNRINLILITMLIFTIGCSTTSNPKSRWMGQTENQLVADLGQPDETVTLDDGRRALIYKRYEVPGQVVPCLESYTIGLNGTVEEFSSSNCTPRQNDPGFRRPLRQF